MGTRTEDDLVLDTVDGLGYLETALHEQARAHHPDSVEARALRARADRVAEHRRHLRRQVYDGSSVAEALPPPVALRVAVDDRLPHCLGCDGTCRLSCPTG